MSDQAPPSDAAGNIYLTTGNGSFNGSTQFGESFLKLTNTGAALSRVDWFTPFDWNTNLNAPSSDRGEGRALANTTSGIPSMRQSSGMVVPVPFGAGQNP